MKTYEASERVVEQIKRAFRYHAPKGDQGVRYELIRADAGILAAKLLARCPESRELSVALTKLDEVVMWANAAIARNE